MTITTEQLAELLAGIARSQQTIIDAIESETGGWRSTHLLPKLNTAANMRIPTARLLDLPSRILLRSQSRVPMDPATIARELATALGNSAPTTTAPSIPPVALAGAGAVVAAAAVAAVVATAAAPESANPSEDEDLNFFDS